MDNSFFLINVGNYSGGFFKLFFSAAGQEQKLQPLSLKG